MSEDASGFSASLPSHDLDAFAPAPDETVALLVRAIEIHAGALHCSGHTACVLLGVALLHAAAATPRPVTH